MRDIFEDMRKKIGCRYISDLKYHKRTVWKELRQMVLTEYETEQIEDFSRYVFDVNYSVLKEVMDILEAKQTA